MSKTACLISLTPVAREARLLRQAAALKTDGWEVFACGLGSDQDMPDWLPLVEVKPAIMPLTLLEEWSLLAKQHWCNWNPEWAQDVYWDRLGNETIFQHIAHVSERRADLVIGHEFFSGPLAARLAELWHCPFSIDCHELASEQYLHDPVWVKNQQTYVKAIEKRFLRKADLVTTVCNSIAQALQETYRLNDKPTTIRSIPVYEAHKFRPAGKEIVIYYHGHVSPLRGLEVLIESLSQWRQEFQLHLRGICSNTYKAELEELAQTHGVSDRLKVLPKVPFVEMVSHAATDGDVGIFVQETPSRHKLYTLPNKLFEYIMASLAICVLDLPEMAIIVNETGVGRLVPELTVNSIAETINGLSREDIDAYKQRSIEVAKTLCWETESVELPKAYNALVTNSSTADNVQTSIAEQ